MKKEYPTTPIILVGNKFDVMPSGTRKQTIIQNIQTYLTSHGLDDNVRAIHLVSAKNPEGDEIRMLLKSIGTAWTKSGKGNVVMVGGENVGKSQLLNAFLKEGGRWRMSGVQVEREKFGAEKAERQKKLSLLLGTSSATSAPEEDIDKEEDKEWAAMTGKDSVGADMDKYEALYKDRGQEKLAKYQTTVSNVPGTTLERIKVPLSVLSRFMGATYKEVQTKWLMDTPGIRPAAGQLTSWLTLEELKVALPKKVLKPVSFTLEEGTFAFFFFDLYMFVCATMVMMLIVNNVFLRRRNREVVLLGRPSQDRLSFHRETNPLTIHHIPGPNNSPSPSSKRLKPSSQTHHLHNPPSPQDIHPGSRQVPGKDQLWPTHHPPTSLWNP